MSLQNKTISGLFWTFSQQFGTQAINFAVSVVLARMLLPSEFGQIGMLTIFMAIGTVLIENGLTSSLIRTAEPDQKDYSTVFFINIIASVLIYTCLYFASPLIANFFDQEILTSVIRVYGITFIIRAFGIVQTTRLTKQMDFKRQMIIQFPSLIAGGITGIGLAYYGYGVWSLVWMNIAQSIFVTVQYWVYTKWKPDFEIDMQRLKHHFNFGYKLTLSGLLDAVYQNIYNLIIGKYFSVAQLGFYTRAYSLRQLPVQNIAQALNKVTYPVFSSIQNDDAKLKMAYKKLMMQVMFWLTPAMLVLALLAEPLIRLVFTGKWLPSVPYFQILCVGGVLYPLHSYNLNILKVKGRTDLFFKLEIVKKLYITIGIFLAFPYGIYGLLYFQLISTCISFYINTFYSGKMIGYPVKEQLADILPYITLASLVAVMIWYLDTFLVGLFQMRDFGRIFICGITYLAVYLGLCEILNLQAMLDFKKLVLKR